LFNAFDGCFSFFLGATLDVDFCSLGEEDLDEFVLAAGIAACYYEDFAVKRWDVGVSECGLAWEPLRH
jgi:hypothetical protein